MDENTRQRMQRAFDDNKKSSNGFFIVTIFVGICLIPFGGVGFAVIIAAIVSAIVSSVADKNLANKYNLDN